MSADTDAKIRYVLQLVAVYASRTAAPMTMDSVQRANVAHENIEREIRSLTEKAAKYDALNTPEIKDFLAAVENEALHQRDIHSHKGDAGKTDAEWFWLLGYLGGKAVHAGTVAGSFELPQGDQAKRLHHIITTAAACLNWHAARVGTYTDMRPGIAAPEEKT